MHVHIISSTTANHTINVLQFTTSQVLITLYYVTILCGYVTKLTIDELSCLTYY